MLKTSVRHFIQFIVHLPKKSRLIDTLRILGKTLKLNWTLVSMFT